MTRPAAHLATCLLLCAGMAPAWSAEPAPAAATTSAPAATSAASPSATPLPDAGKVVVTGSNRRYADAVRTMPRSAGSPCFAERDPLYEITRTQGPDGRRIESDPSAATAAKEAGDDSPAATSRACLMDDRAMAARARIALNDRTWDDGMAAYERKDYAKALDLFKRGYNKIGHANHGYMVGFMLFNGQGVARDPAAGIAAFQKVADAMPYPTDSVAFKPGAPDNSTSKIDALHALAIIYQGGKDTAPDPARARDYFAKAAALGHVVSQVSLARMLEGGQGGARDPQRAFALYQDAASLGYAPAQYLLGRRYASGEGIGADAAKAFQWFNQAASNPNDRSRRALAQYELARMHDEGVGTAKDASKALELYRLAAEAGHVHALAALAHYYYFGEVVEKNHATALQVYRLAAERGSPEAMNALGAMLYRGEGGPANPVDAYRWLHAAERAGVEAAGAAAKAVRASLSPAQLAQASAAGAAP